jgi:murein DD-endopeptidase MepM/ murein hydrolase activator NlpD
MANLRVDDQRRVAPGQAPGGFAAPDASRGADFASRQMQQTGQAVQQGGQLAADIWTKEAEAVNEARVNDALNRAQLAAQTALTEATTLRGEAALRVGEEGQALQDVYVPRFDQQVDAIRTDMGLTAVQTERFNTRLQPLATRYRGALDTHFAKEYDVYRADVANTTVALGQQNIMAAPGDDEEVVRNSRMIAEAVRTEFGRLGRDPAATELAVLEAVGKPHAAAVSAMAARNPREAQEHWERYRDQMTPEQADVAYRTFAPAMRDDNARTNVARMAERLPAPPPGTPGAAFEAVLPGMEVTSGTGARTPFVTLNGQMSSSDHDGVDLRAAAGTSVRAPAAGVVTRAEVNGGYGNYVEVRHNDGTVTFYAHLQDYNIAVGDEVTAGQTFARVGSTGNSTGPHLHLGARNAAGERIDPMSLFQPAAPGSPAPTPPRTAEATRTELLAQVRELYGNNPLELEAHTRAVNDYVDGRDREKTEREAAARDAAYAHIDNTRTRPTPAMIAALPPGMKNAVEAYYQAAVAPPAERSNPEFENFLIANPDQWEGMTRQEFAVYAAGRLSPRDLANYQRDLYRAATTANTAAQALLADLGTVNATDFGAAWRESLGLVGQTPARAGTEQFRDQVALQDSLRTWVAAEQRSRGRVLTPSEIRQEIQNRMVSLQWNGSVFQGGGRRTATSFSEMPRDRVDYYRRVIPLRGGPRNPPNDVIFRAYLADTIPGN